MNQWALSMTLKAFFIMPSTCNIRAGEMPIQARYEAMVFQVIPPPCAISYSSRR